MFCQVKSCLLYTGGTKQICWDLSRVNLKTVFLASHCFMITQQPCKVEGHQTAWCSKFLNLVYGSSVTLWALKPMAWLYVEHTPLRDSYMCNISISLSPGQWCSARRSAAINGGREAQIAGSVNRPQDLFA